MTKERVINGVTSFEFYLDKLMEHNYNQAKTLLEMTGNFLEIADKKEPLDSLCDAKITIQNNFSWHLKEIETEIKIEW